MLVLPFSECHVNDILQFIFVGVWPFFTPYYIYARGLTQAGMYSIVYWFSLLSSIRLCEQTPVYPFCYWWIFELFQVQIALSTAAYQHSCIHLFLYLYSFLLDVFPGVGLLGHRADRNIFRSHCPVVSWSGCTTAGLHSSQWGRRVPVALHLFLYLVWSEFPVLALMVYFGLGVSYDVKCLFTSLALYF